MPIKPLMSPTYSIPASAPSISVHPQRMPPKIHFSLWHTFKHHIPRFLITILIDVILPLAIYVLLQKYIRPVYALLMASSPPLFMVIFKAIWLCTFDALGFLVFFSFTITAAVAVISRSPFIILLEKSLITGILSIIFGVTLIPFQCCRHRCRWRPLAYYFYQDLVPTRRREVGLPDSICKKADEQNGMNYGHLKEADEEEVSVEKLSAKEEVAQVYEWLYGNCSSFRVSCRVITGIWSVGYFLEFLTRVLLILAHLSINKIVIYGHIILTTITVIMVVSSILCITVERKFTLAFIEEWTRKYYYNQPVQQLQLTPVDPSSSFMIVNCDSNCVLSIQA